jgi:hypothetical protein
MVFGACPPKFFLTILADGEMFFVMLLKTCRLNIFPKFLWFSPHIILWKTQINLDG